MSTERKWVASGPIAFTSDGLAQGIVTISSTHLFRVGQKVIITADGEPNLTLKIKRIYTTQKLAVGEVASNIVSRTDLSLYTVAKNAKIEIPEQDRTGIPKDDRERAVYEEEPIMANRVVEVDQYGNIQNDVNPKHTTSREGNVLTNLKTIEIFGLPTDNYLLVDDEIVTLDDGTLVKSI